MSTKKKKSPAVAAPMMQIGGTLGKDGGAVVTALTRALHDAVRLGQNQVAIELGRHLTTIAETKGISVANCQFTGA